MESEGKDGEVEMKGKKQLWVGGSAPRRRAYPVVLMET
jgi:hypothetical protein